MIQRDPIQPGVKGTMPTERGEFEVRLDEGFLHDLLGVDLRTAEIGRSLPTIERRFKLIREIWKGELADG